MKKILTFLFVLTLVPFMQAQWVVESFDNAVGTTFPDPPVLGENFFTNGPTAVFNLINDADSYDGNGSMLMNYRIEAYDGWGGYNVRTTYIPGTVPTEPPYIDLSTGTSLKFRYKVVTPADTTKGGAVFMDFKLAEYAETNNGGRDVWYHHTAMDFFDISGQWIEVTMPLVYNDDNTLGFSNQFADGDGKLQWDKIKGFEMALVYITAGGPTNTPVATGSILIDDLRLVGNRYNPFQTFDNAATGTFSVDDMSWAGTGAGSVALSNNTTDFVEGTGSMQMDYTVNASQTWGGYLNLTDTLFVPDSNFAERTALVFYVKNVNPFVGTTPERVTMRFVLMENNTGANEDWVIEVPINFEQAGDWTRYYLPLKQDTVWTDTNGKTRFPQTGFAQTWWSITGDNKFNLESVTGYKIELSAGDDGYGPVGETFTGTLLFDVIQQSGFQFADKIPPAAPAVTILPSTYSNIVTWVDVPGETGESYNVYYSENPITDVNADGVFLAFNPDLGPFPHGTQVYEHSLRSANTDKAKTYYYAVTCKDFAGNLGEPGFAGPITTTAKGVPTVSVAPPANFVADGNLGEWSSEQPSFVMQSLLGTANVVQNVTDDNDCSAEIKVAIDNQYLYVMMNVTDDFVYQPSNLSPWEQDEPDLYIGLYNRTSNPTAYGSGDKADYQIRFDGTQIRLDGVTDCDSLVMPGDNYYNDVKPFDPGYIIEARIPLVDLATKRNFGVISTDVIDWKAGNRIPFDVGINDNDDGLVRQGIIFYSSTNRDRGYWNVASWNYTWISDDVVGVSELPGSVYSFNLDQNYPNPFNPSTQIKYSIAEAGLVTVKVFDILGREISVLVNKEQAAGSYTVDFNAKNLSTGVYIYRVESGSFQATKKMILIK
jgi:hypothetical protein